MARTTRVTKLVIQDNPGGKYLIKGGDPRIWKERRRSQGIIHGKRCGANVEVKHLAGSKTLRHASVKRLSS
jgi:hypothetical protein